MYWACRMPWKVDGVSLRHPPVTGRSVLVSKANGDPVSGDPAVVAHGVLTTARRNASLFGEGKDSMYRMGPFAVLVDRPISSLRPIAAQRSAINFDDDLRFGDVRLASGVVPALISGAIRNDPAPEGTPLAIAVNGRIRAMTRSFDLDGQRRFGAMMPESAFRDGPERSRGLLGRPLGRHVPARGTRRDRGGRRTGGWRVYE